ncbi:YfjI family protein [Microbulbifer guangxiensis]|uniref:YfjI family protein n=1 Tax=Microbulbifer guangxiensis TaxID=2904249 RepID=UPI001F207079|nr:YfjI family protein [Microbulbifer guangxiensis]
MRNLESAAVQDAPETTFRCTPNRQQVECESSTARNLTTAWSADKRACRQTQEWLQSKFADIAIHPVCDDRLRSPNGAQLTRSGPAYAFSRCGQYAALLAETGIEYFQCPDGDSSGARPFQLMIETEVQNLPLSVAQPTDSPESRAGLSFKPKEKFPAEALGGVLGAAAIEIAEAVQAPVELAAQSILGVASLASQRIGNVIHPETRATIPLSLFLLSLADSGDRKTACDRMASVGIKEYEHELYKVYQQEYSQHLERIKDGETSLAPPVEASLIIQEPTLEGLQKAFVNGQPSQALLNDEAGGFFGGHAMKPENAAKTITGLSKFWDGDDIKRTRVSERIMLTNRRLTVHLLIQTAIAEAILRDPLLQQQGILARFLVCTVDSIAGSRLIDRNQPRVTDNSRKAFHHKVRELLRRSWERDFTGGVILPNIELSREADQAWVKFYNDTEIRLAPGGELELIKPFTAKAAEHALRISAIFAIFDGQEQITVEAMSRAILLTNFYLNSTLRLAQEREAQSTEVEAQKFLEWATDAYNGTVTIEQIDKLSPRGLRLRKNRKHLRAKMELYCELGLLRQVSTDSRGNPNSWEVVNA